MLAITAIIAVAAACGGTEKAAEEPAQTNEAVSSGDSISYQGPQTLGDTEWLLKSLNGDVAAEGSDITLYHDKQELGVEGGCMGFSIIHDLEADHIRVVKPSLQVGRLECGRPEGVRRQAESILGIVRDLDEVRATEDRFELRSEAGGMSAFVPPAPAQVDPALVGIEWLLMSLKGEDRLPKTEVTLEIGEETVDGSSGCNFYGSEVDDGSLVWVLCGAGGSGRISGHLHGRLNDVGDRGRAQSKRQERNFA